VHEAEVALLDQVEKRQPGRLVLLGDRNDEAEVRLDELLGGVLALADGLTELAALGGRELLGGLEFGPRRHPGLDGLGEASLVILGQQVMLADVGQIQPNQVFFFAFDTAIGLCHGSSEFLGSWADRGK